MLPKPGVMDPVAQSTLQALQDMGLPVEQVTTFRKYWLSEVEPDELDRLCQKLLSNDSIERVVVGPLELDKIDVGTEYQFALKHVSIRDLDDEQLQHLSKQGQLYLTLTEMQTIQQHFRTLGREPTDIELETVAQTWSEHCSHKTLAGRIAYSDERGERKFKNMLKETIFQATQTIRAELGADDWCVKVFSDNAGIVKFDDEYHIVFKVETHNHPSAIEPYGGANTGIGGVIRDPMGTGLGAKPFCNTDVFCFAPPDTDPSTLPPGCCTAARDERGRQRRARLRQSHGDSHRQRSGLLRSTLFR
ncbi:MAG: phosphoribosylformylglycinamidine synthase subunit PurS [Pirellulaceae bacterium]